MKRFALYLCCIVAAITSPLRAEFRTWSNTEGSKVEAEFVKLEGDQVTFRLRTGKLISFAENKLSAEDRTFITTHKPQPPQDSPPAVKADRKAKWLTKLAKAQEESKTTGFPILILFTGSTWCPYCIQLEKVVFAEKAFKSFANQNLVLLMLDFGPGGSTKDKEQKKLQEQYGVKGFPTYFLTDATGAKFASDGFYEGINPEIFANWVKKAASKHL